jgi:thiol-disulfide isomerase/thioredoxin
MSSNEIYTESNQLIVLSVFHLKNPVLSQMQSSFLRTYILVIIILSSLISDVRSQSGNTTTTTTSIDSSKIVDDYFISDSEHKNKSSLVKEINDINTLQLFLKHNPKCILEIYSPTCPHCIEFAPKYETLSEIYAGKIKFIKIDGSNPSNYRNLTSVFGFPTMMIYDDGKLFEYKGEREVESITFFIENVYYFMCKKIEDEVRLIDFINANKKSNFILGIFSIDDRETIENFKRLNFENKNIIESCYYYIKKEENFLSESKLFFLGSNQNNFIISYNQINFSFFTDLNHLIKYKNNPFILNQVHKNYADFILNSLFSKYEIFSDSRMHNIMSRNKKLLIFSYQTEGEKILMEDLIDQFSSISKEANKHEYTLVLFKIEEEKMEEGKWRWYTFSQKSGIFLTSSRMMPLDSIENPKMFDIHSILLLVTVENQKESKNKIQVNETLNSGVKYVSAKIVDNLKNLKDELDTNENNLKIINESPKNLTETEILEYKEIEKDNENEKKHKNSTIDLSNKSTDTINEKNSISFLIYKLLIYLPIYSLFFYILGNKIPYLAPIDVSKDN